MGALPPQRRDPMDSDRFDALTHMLSLGRSRREITPLLGGLTFGAVLTPLLTLAEAEAKRKKKKKKRKKRHTTVPVSPVPVSPPVQTVYVCPMAPTANVKNVTNNR